MIFNGEHLTPTAKGKAIGSNYTWYNDKGSYPVKAGYVFLDKQAMAKQVNEDYPFGVPFELNRQPEYRGNNTVIGGPGFGWYGTPPRRFPHIGGVFIGEHVEVGSCVTIDRGALGDTIIGSFVKIDNGVHVGHNCMIGERANLTAHVCLGGSVVIGEGAWIGMGATIKNQIRVGARAVVGMGAIVIKDVEPDTTVVGNPARELK